MKKYMACGAVDSYTSTILCANEGAPGLRVNEGHALIVDGFEQTLYDYLKRDFPLGVKVNQVEASSEVHVWNEQRKIANNTKAIDPRLGIGTTTPDFGVAVTDTDYGRDNWQQAVPHAYANRIQYDYFRIKSEERYGNFEDLNAKDYKDMFTAFAKTTTNDFWNGRATSLDDSSSTYKAEYCGILNQITDTSAIASGTKMVDALRRKMSSLAARLDYSAMPDVIAMNPVTYQMLIEEEESRSLYSQNITAEIIPGHVVPAIRTAGGLIPVIQTEFIKPETKTTGSGESAVTTTTHKIVALNSSMIDHVWWFNNGAKVFEIANPNNPYNNTRLLTDKMILDYSTYILRAPHTSAHFILTLTK